MPPLWRPLSVAFPRVFGRFNRATSAKQSSYKLRHGSSATGAGAAAAAAAANANAAIHLQSVERQRQRQKRRLDDSWMTITDTKSSDEEGGEEEDEERIHGTVWRGSQDRIVRDTDNTGAMVTSDGPPGGSATDSRIMKTTQFSIRYDHMSDGEEREMAYTRLGLRPPRG